MPYVQYKVEHWKRLSEWGEYIDIDSIAERIM